MIQTGRACVCMKVGAALRVSTDSTAGVVLDVQPIQAEGQSGAFRVAITNGQSWPTIVTLAARAQGGGLRIKIDLATPMSVPAQGTVHATMRVTPYRASRPPADHTYELEVCSLHPAPDGPYLVQTTTCARFAYAPRRTIPGWLRWSAILILLLICGAVAYLFVPKSLSDKTTSNNSPPRAPSEAVSPAATSRAANTPSTAMATPHAVSHPAQSHQTRRASAPANGPPEPIGHASATPIFIMTIPTTLRSQPRVDAPRTVLVPRGQQVTAAGASTAHWRYVVFKGRQRGWVMKEHLSPMH